MKTLYAKFALGISISLCLSFAIFISFLKPLLDSHSRAAVSRDFIGPMLRMAAQAVDQNTNLPATLMRLEEATGLSATVIPAQSLEADLVPIPESSGVYINNLRPALRKKHGLFAYTYVNGGRDLLVMGPIIKPQPPSGFRYALFAVAIVVISGGAAILVVPLVRRLRRLERGLRALSEQQFKTRIAVDSKDAIGHLAATFNNMAARINQLFIERQELMQAVSHELGTPLSRMRLQVELLRQAHSIEGQRRHLRALEDELNELDDLTTELVGWIEADATPDQECRTDAQRVLEQSVAYCRELGEIDVVLEIQDGDAGWVYADQRQFQRALDNMLRNAERYAIEHIVVSGMHVAGELRVEVRDDGPGVPPGQRERVFEPFARIEASRSREHGGFGLGLAIVRRIVEKYGGWVAVEDAPEGGAAFITTWPRCAP